MNLYDLTASLQNDYEPIRATLELEQREAENAELLREHARNWQAYLKASSVPHKATCFIWELGEAECSCGVRKGVERTLPPYRVTGREMARVGLTPFSVERLDRELAA